MAFRPLRMKGLFVFFESLYPQRLMAIIKNGGVPMKKVVFVGAGSMAEALIAGITANGLVNSKDIWVTNRRDQERLNHLQEKYDVTVTYDKETLFEGAEAVILAMKPKDAMAGLEKIMPHLTGNMLI